MSDVYGMVYMTDPGLLSSGAWRGIIWGENSKQIFYGKRRPSRSLAFAEMVAANKAQSLGARLVEPLPDDPVEA